MTFFIFYSLFLSELTWSDQSPKNIPLPPTLKSRSAPQIKSIFSSLQNTYSKETGTIWWLKIKQAFLLKEREEPFFCSHMKELSESPTFPLHQLALLYFYETCPLPEPPAFQLDSFPQWLQLKATKSFYRRYTKFKNTSLLLDSTLELIKRTPDKDLKTSYIQQAISLTKKLNDPRREKLKKQLIDLNPYLRSNPTFDHYIPIARTYKRKRSFKKAIYFYRKALNSNQASPQDKNVCYKSLKQIYKLQRKHKKYLLTSKQWSHWLLRQNTKQALRKHYKNQITVARYYWNRHHDKKALDVLETILKKPLSSSVQGEIHWLKGSIKIKMKEKAQIEEGLQELSKSIVLLKKGKKNQELLEKVLWKKAWILRERNQFQKALQSFTELEQTTQNTYRKSRVLFWKGQTLSDLKKHQEKINTFNELIKEKPLSYYGLMAAKDLKKPLNIHKNNENHLIQDTKLDQKSLSIIPWLISLNEKEVLQSFLRFEKEKLLKKKNKTLEDWKSFFSIQTLAKQYLNVFFTFRELRRSFQKYFLNHRIELLFPLEFEGKIKMIAEKWKIPPALIFAIIRQESAFNPKARSPADAFGLMQLIPSTARSIAIQIKRPYNGIKDLYDPLKNITLGAFYIKKLLKRYDGSFILSLAAYNAGGTPVKAWESSLDKTNSLEFIENIPYAETRAYVKLLIRNFIVYNAILNKESSPFPNLIFNINKKEDQNEKTKTL